MMIWRTLLCLFLIGSSTCLAELSLKAGDRLTKANAKGWTEVAPGNRKGQTFELAKPRSLPSLSIQVGSVNAAKDLSVEIFKAPKGFPVGDALFADRGTLPKSLQAQQSLQVTFEKPVELPAGTYAIILSTEASTLRFQLAVGRYPDGRLIRSRDKAAWTNGAGKDSDLLFELPGSGIEQVAAKELPKPKDTNARVFTLNHEVSRDVTALHEKLPARPNIVVCMVDDLGWNQISVSQSTMGTARREYPTPHLEMLAANGLSFTHAYAQPNCAPTRAAMLSGQYPARIHNDVYIVGNLNRNGGGGISKAKARFIGPKQTQDVAADAVTIGEAMKQNGYATAHVGKYHVGGHDGPETLPENVGFDINIGGYSQGHQSACFATRKGESWTFKGLGRGHFDRFGTPYTEDYVKQHGFPESLVGTPKHVSDALGDAMEESITKLHATGNPFYLQLHNYAVHGPVRSRPDLKAAGGSELAGFIAGIDLNIGRLLKRLADPNQDGDNSDSIADHTVILFTSDNGGTHGNNLPLRGKKGMFTEGGMRVPLIAYWPGVIPPNTVTDHMVHSLDYYPTCLALAGGEWLPPTAEHPLDGHSFAEVLRQPDLAQARPPLFFLFPGYMDVRAQPCVVGMDELDGKRYKLLYFYEADAWQLYNITDDIGEATNLIETQPEVASRISKKINAWLTQQHPTWKPKYPILKSTGESAGPPPVL